jgi:hypothetical protein
MIKSLKDIMSPYMICNIYFPKFQLFLQFGIQFLGGNEDNSNKKHLEYKKVIKSMF